AGKVRKRRALARRFAGVSSPRGLRRPLPPSAVATEERQGRAPSAAGTRAERRRGSGTSAVRRGSRGRATPRAGTSAAASWGPFIIVSDLFSAKKEEGWCEKKEGWCAKKEEGWCAKKEEG
uniref:Uncharacterized protein n=1 Tax=Aegilops tauschii subsp. strangulata TaxID=200361 RepID=A0A453IZF5_AEGTS